MADDRQEPRDASDPDGAGPQRDPDAERTRESSPSGDANSEPPRPRVSGQERPPVWSGRAGVPQPGQRVVREAAPADWSDGDDQLNDRWWMPIVVGLVALFLFGALAAAVWWIVGSDKGGGTPAPVPTIASTPPSATVSPTTIAPTSAEPTPSGSTAHSLPVPPLVGLPQQTARNVLDQLGIGYRLRFRVSDQPVGTVLETDPAAGAPIAPGELVTLVIAQASNAPSGTPGPVTNRPGTFGPSLSASPLVTG